MLITDVSLLLVMLVGLFRLRRRGSTFGLAQVLWRQVGLRFYPCFFFRSIDMFSFCKGVLWIFLATVAEVPPAVSPANSSFLSFLLIFRYVLGVHPFKFEWYFFSACFVLNVY